MLSAVLQYTSCVQLLDDCSLLHFWHILGLHVLVDWCVLHGCGLLDDLWLVCTWWPVYLMIEVLYDVSVLDDCSLSMPGMYLMTAVYLMTSWSIIITSYALSKVIITMFCLIQLESRVSIDFDFVNIYAVTHLGYYAEMEGIRQTVALCLMATMRGQIMFRNCVT